MAKYKIGDIFSVNISDNKCRFFQYIADDSTQLNSNVIRVFKKEYSNNDNIDLNNIVNSGVDFYAHVILKLGVKLNIWEKIENIKYGNGCEIIFRDSSDYGNPNIKVSKNWWVWKINEEQKSIGPLSDEYKNAEIGIVINPNAILKRLETGKYQFVYPGF